METGSGEHHIRLLFYKDGALIVHINLLTGTYFLPTVNATLDRESYVDAIHKRYRIDVGDTDLVKEGMRHFLFIGEWEGTYTVDDDALRSRWVRIDEVREPGLLAVRRRYRDIVDAKGSTIGIATVAETGKYALRYRALLVGKERHPFILGETLSGALKRCKQKDREIEGRADPLADCFVYEVK